MTPTQIQAYLLWLNKGNPPGSLGDSFLGGPWPLGFTEGLVLTPEEFGAVGDDSTDDTAAINAWIVQILATGLPGYMRKLYKCTSAITIDLTSRPNGIKIVGTGGKTAGFDLATVSSGPVLKIINSGNTGAFFSVFSDFQVIADVAGIAVALGQTNFDDALNSFVFRNITIGNNSTSASAVGIQLNYVLNAVFDNLVSNCNGHGDALQSNQCQFSTFLSGSFSTADIGVHFKTGYSFANVWTGSDMENVGVCVQADISTASDQTFLGPQLDWSGTSAFVLNECSNYFRVIGGNKGVSGTVVTGAAANKLLWGDQFLGTDPFGGIIISPASGTDAVMQLNAASGQSAEAQAKVAGLITWSWGMNNASPSSWQLTRYSGGTAVDNPIAITASSGIVQMVDGVEINGLGTGSWSLWASTPLTAPPSGTAANRNPSNAGSIGEVFQDTTFTGGIGSTAYALPDIVALLKSLGLIAP